MIQNQYTSLLLDQTKDLIWAVDHHFCLLYANKAYLDLMKTVTGKEKKIYEPIFVEGFGDGYIKKWKAYYERGLKGEHFEIEEHFYNAATNQVEYSQIIFNPIVNKKNVVVNLACQSRDITSFKKSNAEAAIIMDASLDVICSIDEQGIFTKVNAACKELWGYEKEELIGKAYIDLVIEEDIEKTNEVAAEIFSGKTVTTFENRYKRKDGGIAFNLWSVRYDQNTKNLFCVARDAREKIKKEEVLIESEHRFKALVQEGSDLIAILNEAGIYTYVSPTSLTILGMAPEEFIGKNPFDFIHPDDTEKTLNSLSKIATESRIEVEPFRFQNKNGEWRWIETILTNMLDNPDIKGIVANSRDITQRKKSQLELLEAIKKAEESDARFKSYAQQSPIAIYTTDINGDCMYANKTWLEMAGMKLENALGKGWINALHPDDLEYVSENWYKSVESDSEWNYEYRFVNSNKNIFWVNGGAKKLFNDKNELIGYLGSNVNITERKKADAEIAKSEERRRLIMNGALDAIITIDINETISFWNLQAEAIFGWKAEEVIGKQLSEMIIPEHFRKYHVEGLKNYLKTGEGKALNVLLELSAIRRNKEEFPIELTVIPIKQGGEEFFCAFIRDITERKIIEQQKNSLLTTLEKSLNEIYVFDAATLKFSYVNQGALINIGYSEKEMKMLTVLDVKPDYTETTYKQLVHPLVTKEKEKIILFTNQKRKNGSLYPVEAHLQLVEEGNNKRFLAVILDITERKQNEIEVLDINKKLNIQTKELQRSNEELERFAFIASHDLQEPLRMISSFMDQLKRKYGDRLDEKALQYIYFATDGAKRMKQIILDLLLYSRANKSTEQNELINLNEIVSEFTQLRTKLIDEKRATITYHGLPSIETYRAPITQIFHCLLDNALKYVDENKSPIIEIDVIEKNDVWQFAIKDNGVGIDPKFYDKIFIIFQRLQNRKEEDGTGIGLAIAKRSIEFLGGKIWVESKIDLGSTFYFTILKIKQHI